MMTNPNQATSPNVLPDLFFPPAPLREHIFPFRRISMLLTLTSQVTRSSRGDAVASSDYISNPRTIIGVWRDLAHATGTRWSHDTRNFVPLRRRALSVRSER